MGAFNVATWFRLSCQPAFPKVFQAEQKARAARPGGRSARFGPEKSAGKKCFKNHAGI
jgi:hypothetical protein